VVMPVFHQAPFGALSERRSTTNEQRSPNNEVRALPFVDAFPHFVTDFVRSHIRSSGVRGRLPQNVGGIYQLRVPRPATGRASPPSPNTPPFP